MDFFSRLGSTLADGRLGVNLIAVHGLITLVVLGSLILRRLLQHGQSRLIRWSGLRWLEAAGEEAVRHARAVLFWLTMGSVALALAGGVAYHSAGRDIRSDITEWSSHLTLSDVL